MTRSELTNLVKTKVDELSAPDDDVATDMADNRPVNDFIGELLDECAREVVANAPAWRLSGFASQPEIHPNNDGSGYVVLPEGFLRLLEFKMKEWKRPVNQVAAAGSPVAVKQGNLHLRGGICKPVCVWGQVSDARVLHYYSVQKKHDVEKFIYMSQVAAEDVDVDLQDVLTWWCASRVLQIVGKSAEAQLAYQRGKSLL